MPGSKEIAEKALLLAKEISARKNLRRRRVENAIKILSIIIIIILNIILIKIYPPIHVLNNETVIDENDVPLGLWTFGEENSTSEPENAPVFTIPWYDKIVFTADSFDVKMKLQNPADNKCRLTFEIVLQDTGESLYMSDYIEPSENIENFRLTRTLSKGGYKAVIIIRAYEPDSLAEINSAKLTVDLIVE